MSKKYLIITEGAEMEPSFIIPLLKKYGFDVRKEEKINVEIDTEISNFDKIQIENDNNDVIIVAQGPRNRIKDLINLFNNQKYALEKFFENSGDVFAGIFLFYDVDQTLKEDLDKAFVKFNNEQDGLLLISSPCIEVLAHEDNANIKEISGIHVSKEYKSKINKYISDNYHVKVSQYIYENFEKISLKYLIMNVNEFNSNNIMEHPQLIINKINEMNDRHIIGDNLVQFTYRYFSTVVYVAIAYILGYTKEFDNAIAFKDFLENFDVENSISK